MKYQILVHEIIKKLGAKENIVSVTNCMTRLRFVLKDFTIPIETEVKNIEGVVGVVNKGGQYQVIVGTHVNEVITEIKAELGINEKSCDDEEGEKENGNAFNRFFKMISGCIFPIMVPLIGGGILRGILAALLGFNLITRESGTFQILFGAADAIFYFFPVIIGFSAAKVFKINQYLGATIGGALIYPALIGAEGLSFIGVTVVSASYANTVFPIIVAVWFASIVTRIFNKFVPDVIQDIITPTIVLAITVPTTFLVIGPVVNALSTGILNMITFIYGVSPPLVGLLMSGLWQLLVLLGIHMAIIPVFINEIAVNGYTYIGPLAGLGHWGIIGMTLGLALATKNKKKKASSVSSMIVAFFGITEPAIYSIAILNIKLFVCAMIGSGVAGFIFASLGAKSFGTGVGGIFGGALFIGPDGIDRNFTIWLICAVTGTIISAILAYSVTKNEIKRGIEND